MPTVRSKSARLCMALRAALLGLMSFAANTGEGFAQVCSKPVGSTSYNCSTDAERGTFCEEYPATYGCRDCYRGYIRKDKCVRLTLPIKEMGREVGTVEVRFFNGGPKITLDKDLHKILWRQVESGQGVLLNKRKNEPGIYDPFIVWGAGENVEGRLVGLDLSTDGPTVTIVPRASDNLLAGLWKDLSDDNVSVLIGKQSEGEDRHGGGLQVGVTTVPKPANP